MIGAHRLPGIIDRLWGMMASVKEAAGTVASVRTTPKPLLDAAAQ
ncbi:hypothetical protein [Streptomyces sp. NPDC006285]